MSVKLIKFFSEFRLFGFLICLNVFFAQKVIAQDCSQSLNFDFKPTLNQQNVNWAQFPEFSLPFKVVYGGFQSYANSDLMLKRGYTHLSVPNDLTRLPVKNRAVIYYNCGNPSQNQPWELIKSPWGNNLDIYRKYWDENIVRMKESTNTKATIDADIFVFDIERQIKSDDSILVLKNYSSTPANIKNLSNEKFILEYKKQIQALYQTTVDYTLKNGKPTAKYVSSYSDTPILNTFVNIQGRTWEQWKVEKSAINYLTYDFDNAKVGGKHFESLSLLTPTAYFYYDYPHPFAGEYLSYLLFQCEANRAWTNKELMLFVWTKYSFNRDYINQRIKPWMAEASAIFPFFAGAKGIWFWENTSDLKPNDNLATYEYFTKGLYRLSQYKSIFEGDYKPIEAISARDYNENKLPIWRGVANKGKILVAAHNPFAKNDQEIVNLNMKFGNWSRDIKLKGYEIYLCEYDFNVKTNIDLEINDLVVYPNPSQEFIKFTLKLNAPQDVMLKVYDLNGKIIYSETFQNAPVLLEKTLNVSKINVPEIIISLETSSDKKTKKVILRN